VAWRQRRIAVQRVFISRPRRRVLNRKNMRCGRKPTHSDTCW
jgi:hypothetical protein